MRPRSGNFSRLALAYGSVIGVLAVFVALFGSIGAGDPATRFGWIATASIVVIGSLVAITGVWTATAVYAVVFWCFHFGLIATLSTGYITTADLPFGDESWIVGPFSSDAALLALAGTMAFAAGAIITYARRCWFAPNQREQDPQDVAHPNGVVGSALVFCSVATWGAIVVLAGGVTGFFTSYEEFLQMTSEFSLPIAIIAPALACGVVLSVTGKRGWHRTAAIASFACFALVALPIGLRSEVMFPVVAAIVASARCGTSFSPVKAATVGLALLLLVPIVREVRNTGVTALPEALAAPRLDGLVEMGQSLRPVDQVIRWHAEGEPYEWGSSYWAPFERAAARLLPGLEVARADDDLRLMNVLVLDRIGAIGFSPVAEAYRNFGPVGVVIVLGLLGVALGGIDTIRDRRRAVLAIAAIYPPLLINVRNSFVSVPAQCAVAVLLVFGVAAVRHVVASVLPNTYARTAYVRS